ncbi:MAG: LPS assembly lipoprotein LptE [Plesiomonas sp.]|uniref:LPS assembly lipoprotein LptE n=1 Tax=Plesiomonas sp. TaxID=2486279 RepID=UPI003F2DD605
MLKHLRFKSLMLILTVVAIATTAGCGFHLRGTTQIPTNLQTMTLHSYDPYGPLTRAMREQMKLNNITLIDEQKANSDIPTFRLNSASQGNIVSSVFNNGIAAERNITLTVNASVLIPGQDVYPISVQISRAFFDNPNTALAKAAEASLLNDEMYQEAARRLMLKLLTINPKHVVTPRTPETH